MIRDEEYVEKAEIFREKGTDRSKYFRGQIDKYRWQDFGSSYLPSEMNVAYLYAQLLQRDLIQTQRMDCYNTYRELLSPLENAGRIELPFVPEYCEHNAHMFYIKCADMEERTRLIGYLKERDIMAVFHYIPLHSAPAGIKFGRTPAPMPVTDRIGDTLVRLPLFYSLIFLPFSGIITPWT